MHSAIQYHLSLTFLSRYALIQFITLVCGHFIIMKFLTALFIAGCTLLGFGIAYEGISLITKNKGTTKSKKQKQKKTPTPKKNIVHEQPLPHTHNEKTDEEKPAITEPTAIIQVKKPDIVDSKFLCDVVIEMKIESMELFFEYAKAIESSEKDNIQTIYVAFCKEFDTMILTVLNKYQWTKEQFQETLKKFESDSDVSNAMKELEQYKEELKEGKMPSIFKKYFDIEIFNKIYPLFLNIQWHGYYIRYTELLASKVPDKDNKLKVEKEEVLKILTEVSNSNLADSVLSKLKVTPVVSKLLNSELMIHSTFFYLLQSDPIYGNQLTFLNEINRAIFSLIQRGQPFEELKINPLSMEQSEIEKNFNNLTKRIKKYIDVMKSYLQQAYSAKYAGSEFAQEKKEDESNEEQKYS